MSRMLQATPLTLWHEKPEQISLRMLPLDKALSSTDAKAMADAHRVAVPTLIMMKGVAENVKSPFLNFQHASQSVTALHEAGVMVLADTDANAQPGISSKVAHGESLHQEFEPFGGSWYVHHRRSKSSHDLAYAMLRT